MTAISELASAARESAAGGRRMVMVRDLRARMTVALPYREFHLPWLVLAEPVPVSPDTSLVMIRRVLGAGAPGVPVGVKFFQTALVDLLPRHYGVCSRCGGLSPCVDEWVESTLNALDGDRAIVESPVATDGEVAQ